MESSKKIYTVQIWLKSQDKPIEYETDWAYINESELNNPNPAFIKIEDNYYRKEDILKIMVVSVREEKEEKQSENKQDNNAPF